jgi:hypothetical protein
VFEKSDQQLIDKALLGNKKAWLNLLKRYESPFILPDFTPFQGRRNQSNQDRIYVFKQKDIQVCVRDKISIEQLLAQSAAYDF